MARISNDSWVAARAAWESDPTMTMGKLADAIGVAKQSVHKRMKKDEAAGNPWQKRVSMAEVAERAQAMADKQQRVMTSEVVDGAKTQSAPGKVTAGDASVNQKKIARGPDDASPSGNAVSTASIGLPDPVAQRAEIIGKHRREWGIPRGLVSEAVGGRNFDKAKLAKITSETLQIIQKGERTAWGLDALDPDAKPPVVIIERSGAEAKK